MSNAASRPTFNVLEREDSFRYPTEEGSTVPILNEFVRPYIESFNALFDDSGLPPGDGDGRGLLSLGLQEMGQRIIFDGLGQLGLDGCTPELGNRMTGKSKIMIQWIL